MSEQVERNARSSVQDADSVRRALGFFKVMAIIAGLAMFVLITEMILKYGLSNEALSWWSPIHGFLFLIFAISVVNLGFKMGWAFGRMVGIVLVSCVPFLAFWIEHKVAGEVEPRLAGNLSS